MKLFLIFNLLFLYYNHINCSVNCKGFLIQHGRLKVLNNQLVDTYNQPIQLRGLTSTGFGASLYRSACVSKESITYAVLNYGITVFRLPIFISSSENGYQSNSAFFDSYINDVVTWCEDLGIYVIIDWHVTNPGDPNYWLDSPGASTGLAITFWKKMATKYKTKLHVMYEIANEPSNVTWTNVLLYHNSVIKEIRAIDTANIIIAGTTHWSQDIDLPYIEPVTLKNNVLYSFHFYAASHEFLYEIASTYLDLVPVFSVWGASESSGTGTVNYTISSKFLDLFAGLKETTTITSWTMYAMSDAAQTSSTLTVTSCTKKTWASFSATGNFINSYLLDSDYFIDNDITWCNPAPTGQPTGQPSSQPTISFHPTGQPTGLPSSIPTGQPTGQPTSIPTSQPTGLFIPNSNEPTEPLNTYAIVGITVGSIVILSIAFIIIAYVVKSSTKKSNYQYDNPVGDIALHDNYGNGGNNNNNDNNGEFSGINEIENGNGNMKRGQYQTVSGLSKTEYLQNDDPDFTTATIYRNGDSSISHDITVPASHDHSIEKRGRQMTKNSGQSQKRPSHSPPPTNPLHNGAKKRQSSTKSKSPVPQGSRKKRNSSRSPSPAR